MHDKNTSSSPPRDIRFNIAGVITVCVALGGFYASSLPAYIENEWLRMGSMALGVVGVIIFMFSGMTPAHRKEWIKQGMIALGIALVIRWSVGEPYRIPSASMETTLLGDERIGRGDRVFVNKWVYGVRYPFMNKRIWQGQDPQRWDIVVFKTVEEDAQHTTLVKRIVGLPGERIHIADNKVYVNGETLVIPDFMPEDQNYTSPHGIYSDFRYGILESDEFSLIPEGHYLVLGDNSESSRDGRVFGWLPKDHIMGRVSCIWWPPTRWRDFSGFTSSWWWKCLLALLVFFTVKRLFIGRSWAIPVKDGKGEDHCLMLFLAYGLRLPFTQSWLRHWADPKRGDLVLYAPDSPLAEPGAVTAGRVVALPGEKVVIDGDTVLLNDEKLSLPFLDGKNYVISDAEAIYGRGKNKKNTTVPEGMCFILTEHPEHENALDSRSLGWVRIDRVVAKAGFVWWPVWRFRKVS